MVFHLLEKYNSTQFLKPNFEQHISFVTNYRNVSILGLKYWKSKNLKEKFFWQVGCASVHNIQQDQQCNFIKTSTDCQEAMQIFDYMSFTYCIFNTENKIINLLGIILLCIWCCYLFAILGTTADKL